MQRVLDTDKLLDAYSHFVVRLFFSQTRMNRRIFLAFEKLLMEHRLRYVYRRELITCILSISNVIYYVYQSTLSHEQLQHFNQVCQVTHTHTISPSYTDTYNLKTSTAST